MKMLFKKQTIPLTIVSLLLSEKSSLNQVSSLPTVSSAPFPPQNQRQGNTSSFAFEENVTI